MSNYVDAMRGETSSPLQEAIFSALSEMASDGFNFLSVQVPSHRLVKGVSLIVRTVESLHIQLVYARHEMGGFMPPKIFGGLTNAGWTISGDVFGQKYVVLNLSMAQADFRLASVLTCHGLEQLGVPQRKSWTFKPDFKLLQ